MKAKAINVVSSGKTKAKETHRSDNTVALQVDCPFDGFTVMNVDSSRLMDTYSTSLKGTLIITLTEEEAAVDKLSLRFAPLEKEADDPEPDSNPAPDGSVDT